MKNSKRNPKTETEKRSISAPQQLFQKADERVEIGMFPTFSAYVQNLMKRDLIGELEHAHASKKST